jgi:prophage regulatory protein
MKFLKKKAVCEMVSYAPAHIDRLEKAGKFPRRVTLGQARVAWVEDEIRDWMQRRMDEREPQ